MISVKCLDSLKCPIVSIVKDQISDNTKTLFIVPETSKASVERLIFEALSKNGKSNIKVGEDIVTAGVIKYDVLSFLKFAQRIVSNSGDDTITGFDDIVLRNVIYHIFVKHGSEFKNFSKYVNRFEYIDRLIELLGDFTRFGITTDDLDEVINHADSLDDIFYDKVSDLKTLVEYIHEINDAYGFSLLSSDITRATNFIDGALSNGEIPRRRLYSYIRLLKNYRIVIYGFGFSRTFTPQELGFVKALDKLGCSIDIYVLYSDSASESDVYYFGDALISSLRKDGVEFNIESVYSEGTSPDRDIDKITDAIAFDKEIKLPAADGTVEFFRLSDPDNTLSFVCNEIIRLTREEGYRYKDIRVFSPNDETTERFKGIMRLFGLDAFIDKRMILDSTPVMRFVEVFLQLPTYNYNLDFVIRILRTGLLPIRFEMVDYFENYCVRENITNGDRLFEKSRFIPAPELKRDPFKMYINGELKVHGGEYLWTSVVEKILIPLKNICDKVYNDELISTKAADLLNYLDSLRYNIEALRDEFIDNKDTASASILVRSFKEVMTLLTSFTSDLNDVAVSHELFAFLLKVDMRNKVIATIPLTLDSIELVDFDSACFTPCKVLFMIGCDSTNFPYSGVSEGIMSNNELIRLNSEMEAELPVRLQTRSREDFIKSSLVLSAATEKIVIMLGNDLDYDSETFSTIKSFYGTNVEKHVAFETPVYGLATKKRHDVSACNIDEEYMKELLKNGSWGSVSSFETFNYCPFEYVMEKILQIDKREDGTRVLLNEVGTIAHAMFENVIKDMIGDSSTTAVLKEYREKIDDPDYVKELSFKYFDKALSESKMPDKNTTLYSVDLGSKVRRIFTRALPKLLDYCIEENYIPFAFEQDLKELPNKLTFKTENGIDFTFTGYIDRVDRNPDTGMLRIVDYKTGKKYVDKKKLAPGLQFQLFAYALAMAEQGDKIDNVGYFEIGLRPNKIDNTDGTDYSYKNSSFSPEETEEAIGYIKNMIRNTCEQVSKGRAEALVNPQADQGQYSSCSYCPFSGYCGNDCKSLKTSEDCKLEDPDKDEYKSGRGKSNRYYLDLLKKWSEKPWDSHHNK